MDRLEIYLSNLSVEAQGRVLNFYGLDNFEDGNSDLFILFVLEK